VFYEVKGEVHVKCPNFVDLIQVLFFLIRIRRIKEWSFVGINNLTNSVITIIGEIEH
jgi:hypothetical protein